MSLLAQAAQQAATGADRVVPVITASATVLAAIIGGFLAAALKHRWDVQDDERRWGRERAERRREELKQAFNDYLAARAETEGLLAIHSFGAGTPVDGGRTFFTLLRRMTQLKVLLPSDDVPTLEKDVEEFGNWVHTSIASVNNGNEHFVMAPDDELVRRLAKRLLDA